MHQQTVGEAVQAMDAGSEKIEARMKQGDAFIAWRG